MVCMACSPPPHTHLLQLRRLSDPHKQLVLAPCWREREGGFFCLCGARLRSLCSTGGGGQWERWQVCQGRIQRPHTAHSCPAAAVGDEVRALCHVMFWLWPTFRGKGLHFEFPGKSFNKEIISMQPAFKGFLFCLFYKSSVVKNAFFKGLFKYPSKPGQDLPAATECQQCGASPMGKGARVHDSSTLQACALNIGAVSMLQPNPHLIYSASCTLLGTWGLKCSA